ncbi:MAG: hypothetical protein ACKOW9_04975 [Candidatus Paceibacterota bacterium]
MKKNIKKIVLGSFLIFLLITSTSPSFADSHLPQGESAITQVDSNVSANVDDLPAWRWSVVELDGDTSGWLGAVKSFPIIISTLLLGISQFLWNLLLGLLKFSLDTGSLIEPAAGPINSAFSNIGTYSVAIFGLLWAVILWRVVTFMLKGRTAEALRSGGVFLLLFAMLLGLISASSNAVDSGNPLAKGTLPWLANKVSTFSTGLVSNLTVGRDLFGQVSDTKSVLGSEGTSPTCAAYINELHRRYTDTPGSNPVLSSVSRLWENTQYMSWTISAFGTPSKNSINLPGRTMCHWAESSNGVSSTEQQDLSSVVYGDAIPAVDSGVRPTVFGPYGKNDRRRAMTAWAACQWNDTTRSWETTPEFVGVFSDDPSGDTYGNKWCSDVLSSSGAGVDEGKGWFINVGDWDNFNMFGGRIVDAFEREGQTPDHREKIAAAKAWATAFSGANTSDRLLQGLLALIIAIFFLYSLGFIAIGMFIAQLLLVLLLMMAPVTLTMFALGSKKAMPLLKLTGTTMVSQAVFGLLLTMLVSLSELFQAIVVNLSSFSSAGFIKTLLFGLAPLLAFYCVRKLLMFAGMADILKPTGAVGFLVAASAVATNDSSVNKYAKVNKEGKDFVSESLKKTPGLGGYLRRAETTAPTIKNWNKEGRENRKNQLLANDKEIRERMSSRLSNEQMSRRDKISNFLDARKLSDDKFGKVLRTASSLGPAALGGLAFGPAALAGAALGSAAGLSATGMAGVAGIAAMGAGGGLYAKRLNSAKPLEDADTSVQVKSIEYKSFNENAGANELELAAFTRELKTNPGLSNDLLHDFVERRFNSSALFDSVGTLQELSGARMNIAGNFGLRYDQIDVSPRGIAVPSYVSRDEFHTLPDEAFRHFAYHLPEEDRRPKNGESSAERAERILAIGIARGFVNSDGTLVDALSKLHDIDLDSSEGQRILSNWRSGAEHKTLGKRVARGHNAKLESQLLQVISDIRQRDQIEMANVLQASAVEAFSDLQDAEKNVSDALNNFDSFVSDLEMLVENQVKTAKSLSSARSQGDDRQAEELAAQLRKKGKDLENVFTAIRGKAVDIASVNAQLTLDSLLTLNTFNNESDFTNAVLSEFDKIVNNVSEIEDLLPGAYSGNSEAGQKLISSVRSYVQHNKNESDRLLNDVRSLRESAVNNARQSAAVRRRGSITRTPTTRELIKATEMSEFPS